MPNRHTEPSIEDPLDETLEKRLRFETLLSGIAARLLNVAPEDLGSVIQASLAELGALLGSERGGIALFSEDGRSLVLKYGYFAPGASHALYDTDLARPSPGTPASCGPGGPVILRRASEDLPPEAAAERAAAAAIG